MAFVPKSFEEILIGMIAHIRANTTLTDFTVGSAIRTILEACALEDDEQYYQMVQLLDAFRIATATGTDLDERAADLNLTRLAEKEAFGTVRFRNGGLTTDSLEFDASAGALTITLNDATDFPTSYPYDVRIGEGTPQVEDVTVSNNAATAPGILTVSALVNDHTIGERVSEVTSADITVAAGIQVQVAPSSTNLAIVFATQEAGTIVAGNYQSGLVDMLAATGSSDGNVPAGQVSQFTGSVPFAGALVTNPTATSGGRDLETDTNFRNRLLRRLDELSRGTPLAVEGTVIGVEDTNTGKRVVTSKLQEAFSNDDHKLYVDDGSGLVPEQTIMAQSTLSGAVTVGDTVIALVDVSNFPASGSVLVSPGVSGSVELLSYSAKGTASLTLDTGAANSHLISAEVVLVAIVEASAESGQNFFQLPDFPVGENSYEIHDNSTGEFVQRTDVADYFLNRSNGQIEYTGAGLPAGTQVLANFAYFTGLLEKVQKVLNGDPNDPTNYPGVVAGGVIINVDIPTLRTITVTVSITAQSGFDEDDLADEVAINVAAYVDGLGIGENVIIASIIDVAMDVEGVYNVNVQNPVNDVVILEDELQVSYNSAGTSLIQVL